MLSRKQSGSFRELLEERSMWDGQVFAAGLRPRDFLNQLARAPRSLVVHGNYLARDEMALVTEHRDRMSVVYCPRTHAFFNHTPYPLQAMLDAGARVAIGTDSRASNPDLSLLEELRQLRRAHPEVSPEQILELGTLAGAVALGLGPSVGSLTPGKLANLVAIDCGTGATSPAGDSSRFAGLADATVASRPRGGSLDGVGVVKVSISCGQLFTVTIVVL